MKAQLVFDTALAEQIFASSSVRRRMRANHLGIILGGFILDLHHRGYTCTGIRHHVLVAEHFGRWLKQQGVPLRRLSTSQVHRFLRFHLPRCHCPRPAPKVQEDCRAALGRLVEFLRKAKRIKEAELLTSLPGQANQLITAYDEHMSRVCGLSAQTRRARRSCAHRFLQWRFGRGHIDLGQLRAKEVSAFTLWRVRQLGPAGMHALVVCLRSFLRFLRFAGRLDQDLSGTVPKPVRPIPQPLPKTLEPEQLRRFLNGFPRTSARGRRDYAIALCLSELALRSDEVARLTLDDLDWRAMTVRLALTKQRRQRLLPLSDRVAKAIMNYLKGGRPASRSRGLFVHHLAPIDQPLTAQSVRKLIRIAFTRCGIESTGTYILRHTWATRVHRRGAGLKLIADVLGHRSLNPTARYAHVNLEELRQVALPWPRNMT